MDTKAQICRLPSGPRTAWAETGSGPPLVLVPGWLTHLDGIWSHPAAASARTKLSQRHRLIWYDRLGCGLSDREGFEPTLETDVEQLSAVLAAASIARATLVGYSVGGPVAAAFTARYPEKVERLILYASFARGEALTTQARHEAMKQLIAADWHLGSGAFATLFVPNGSATDLRWFRKFQRQSAHASDAIRLWDYLRTLDVREALTSVLRPTLVLANRRDPAVPLSNAEETAALVPDATMHVLEGNEHEPFIRDSGGVVESILAFAEGRPLPQAEMTQAQSESLTARECEVLRLIAEGGANKEIAARLGIKASTVERHVANVYGKLGARGRADAVMHAIALRLVAAPGR